MSKVYKGKFNYQKRFKPNKKANRQNQKSRDNRRRQLYTDNWDKIRKSVYQRDGYRCVMCGKKGKIHAHHIVPVTISKDNSMNNLVSVCESCHRKLEDVGFKILKEGGHRSDVRKVELRMIAEAKKKRREDYEKKLKEERENKN